MNRAIRKRLESLEQRKTAATGRVHTFMGDDIEDLERQAEERKTSPKWCKGDMAMLIHLVAAEFGQPA
jgi:hypothetical protein